MIKFIHKAINYKTGSKNNLTTTIYAHAMYEFIKKSEYFYKDN